MAFLREGAVKDLMTRGPNKDTLVQWASQNVLTSRENPGERIREYAHQFGLTVSELESLTNIFLGMEQSPSDSDVLLDLLSSIKEAREFGDIREDLHFDNEYINKTKNMKESILMPRLLKEDHHKECSDEASMVKIQLKSIIDEAGEILQGLDSCEQIDAWVQSKISIAEDYISTVAKYMKYEEEEAPAELPLVPAEDELIGGPKASDEPLSLPKDDMMMPPMGPDVEPEGELVQSEIEIDADDELEEPEDDGFDEFAEDDEFSEDDEFVDDEDMEEAEPEEDDLEIFSKADFENIKG
ncbi:MAG TPA: hypothetical protein PK122_00590 [Candidatus Paceibacterota bacterium]|nr:hypothetical protein [Candidatus Paceibacterota bacterium]